MDEWFDVIKLRPDGTEATRYRAVSEVEQIAAPWIAVRAEWVFKRVESHGLVFEPGDSLVEYFSPDHWYNAFRVETPGGDVRGWYGNVTYPASITSGAIQSIVWHDLYLDVIALPDGRVVLCDEDELAESGLEFGNPDLHSRIVQTATAMLRLAETATFPFHRVN